MPSREKIAFLDDAIPTTLSNSPDSFFRVSYCECICSMSFAPTVPTPQMKRFRTLYSDRKKESWITFSDFLRNSLFTTNDIFVSEAPCAHAMIEIPERPRQPNSFPAIPGVCFMFSPTIAMVARPVSAFMGNMAPVSISLANSSLSTLTASSASSSLTPIEVEFSEDA